MLDGAGLTPQVTSQVVGVSYAVPSDVSTTDQAEQHREPLHRYWVPALQMHSVPLCKVVHRHAGQMAGLSPGVKLHNRLADCNSGHSMLERPACAGQALAGQIGLT
jgi:hypothetical protein